MVETNLEFWSKLFFAAFKRKPNNALYGYKRNVVKIRQGYGSRIGSLLRKPDRHTIELELGNNTIGKAHVSQIRNFLLKDIQAPLNSTLKIFRDGEIPIASIWDWKHNSLIFKNPLNPRYCGSSLSGTDRKFIMNRKIQLKIEKGKETLDHILWPSAVFSLSCRGVGVRTEVYREFQKKYGSEIPNLVNPLTGNPSLKMYPVDFVPRDFKAIGLFPTYVETHKSVFKGIDLFSALVKSRPCTKAEIISVNQHLIATQEWSSNINFENADFVGDCDTEGFRVQADLNNLKKWKGISKNYKSFWSPRNVPTDTNIPGDILRCTLLSRDITDAQMKEEFCKHYILFSIFSQAWRIERKLFNEDISKSRLNPPWRSWDLYISQRSREINALPIPNTSEELSDLKTEFDHFLSELFSYYALIVSEMKDETASFFKPTESELPRIVPVSQVLRNILLDNSWVRILYPNLHAYMKNRLRRPPNSNSGYLTVPATIEVYGSTFHSTEKLLIIVRTILELESESRRNRLGQRGGIYVDPQTASNWKIAIVSNRITDPQVRRLLKFNTDISLQFVQNLAYVTNRNDDGWFCQRKKMLDPDNCFYLYCKESHREASTDLANKMISKYGGQRDASRAQVT